MRSLLAVLLVFVGGGIGSVLRYGVSLGAERISAKPALGGFPIGTFIVNIVGCFAIGLVMTSFNKDVLREEHRLLLAVGILGGFTTFSSFAWESITRAHDGQLALALVYILLSNMLGLVAAALGARLATLMIA